LFSVYNIYPTLIHSKVKVSVATKMEKWFHRLSIIVLNNNVSSLMLKLQFPRIIHKATVVIAVTSAVVLTCNGIGSSQVRRLQFKAVRLI
jgi:hypothetical protein